MLNELLEGLDKDMLNDVLDDLSSGRITDNSYTKDSLTGRFLGAVLLPKFKMHRDQIIADFKKLWDIEIDEVISQDKVHLILQIDNMTVRFFLENIGPPKKVLLDAANFNQMWDKGSEAVNKASAFIDVTIEGEGASTQELALLFVKSVTVCCHQKNALAAFSSFVIHDIEAYKHFANLIKRDIFPVMNLVGFLFGVTEFGPSLCTLGLPFFGHKEIEIIGFDNEADRSDLIEFLSDLCLAVIQGQIDLEVISTLEVTDKHRYKIDKDSLASVLCGMDTIKLHPIRD